MIRLFVKDKSVGIHLCRFKLLGYGGGVVVDNREWVGNFYTNFCF